MAILVALIFQVLFVFFAMIVNVGLVVHDKIALQNAVDLGAYYGAMKQAEVLNQIGHLRGCKGCFSSGPRTHRMLTMT